MIGKKEDGSEDAALTGPDNRPVAHASEGSDRCGQLEQIEKASRRSFFRQAGLLAVGGGALVATAVGNQKEADTANAVKWGMIIDTRKCVGCRACTVACKSENHTPPGVAYNVVLENEVGEYPHVTTTFLSRPCMQCEQSSCTKVCPTRATYHRPDGIVAIDYDKCIGCRYCINACPYGARSYDYGDNYHEVENPYEATPSPEYGENRPRRKHKSPQGNVRKCTFCLHRLTKGLAPACASTCMGNAIHFANMADPEAKCMAHGENLHELLRARSHYQLKAEIGNKPNVWYLT